MHYQIPNSQNGPNSDQVIPGTTAEVTLAKVYGKLHVVRSTLDEIETWLEECDRETDPQLTLAKVDALIRGASCDSQSSPT